jgi:hypothetical protein
VRIHGKLKKPVIRTQGKVQRPSVTVLQLASPGVSPSSVTTEINHSSRLPSPANLHRTAQHTPSTTHKRSGSNSYIDMGLSISARDISISPLPRSPSVPLGFYERYEHSLSQSPDSYQPVQDNSDAISIMKSHSTPTVRGERQCLVKRRLTVHRSRKEHHLLCTISMSITYCIVADMKLAGDERKIRFLVGMIWQDYTSPKMLPSQGLHQLDQQLHIWTTPRWRTLYSNFKAHTRWKRRIDYGSSEGTQLIACWMHSRRYDARPVFDFSPSHHIPVA